jgi:hypothetical protein
VQVSFKEALQFAKHADIPLFEGSAKLRINIEETFYQLVREVRWFRNECMYLSSIKYVCNNEIKSVTIHSLIGV